MSNEKLDKTKKYDRGRNKSLKNIKDRKLKANIKRLDEKFNTAAELAATSEYLLLEETGFLESEGPIEKTYKFKQSDITANVDVTTASKAFSLDLKTFGPYNIDYSRSGNSLVIGGAKGHIASFDWKQGVLRSEINVNETVRAVKWLQSDNQFFAAAQKKYTFIYDGQGTEIHCLKNHIEATNLEYLPYHFLLVTSGNTPFLKYQDVSTGQLVAELPTKLGSTVSMAQNPYNAIVHLGHSNGTVTLWAPNMSTPLVKILSNRGPVRSVAINRDGRYMVSAGADRSVKIWDIRNFKQHVHSYYTPTPASSLHISETGLLAAGWGPHVQVWKDMFTSSVEHKQSAPYMNQLFPSSQISNIRFCPFEDFLGVGHSKGFTSMVVPGSGEANFDALEANPYASASSKGRREIEVRDLLNKLKPEMISLDPEFVGSVDKRASAVRLRPSDLEDSTSTTVPETDPKIKINANIKAKNSGLRKMLRRKTANVIDQRKMRIETALQAEKKLRQDKLKLSKGEKLEEPLGPALARFK